MQVLDSIMVIGNGHTADHESHRSGQTNSPWHGMFSSQTQIDSHAEAAAYRRRHSSPPTPSVQFRGGPSPGNFDRALLILW